MLFTALFVLGIVSYQRLEVELLPNVEVPVLFIQVTAPAETDPRYIEQQAVPAVEGAAGLLENVENITTEISPGNAMVIVELSQNADLTASYLKLIERVKAIKQQLPESFTAQVFKIDTGTATNQFMRIQVRGDGSADRIRSLAESKLRNRFLAVNGVATAEVFGGREFSVEIIVNEQRMEAYGITLGQISQSIAGQQSAKVFAGVIRESANELFVTVEADYTSISDLENIILKSEGTIRLKDVATVSFGVKEEDSYSRVNGMEAVTITLSREAQTNLIVLAERVIDEIDEINEEYRAQNIELTVESNGAETMQTNIDRVISLAITGGLLAIFLLWIFLKNIYLVFVAMIAIPVSVYSAFNFFYGASVSINILTLVGLALAVGMLIDNNVVVMENIHRLSSSGIPLRESVLRGTKQMWRSVTASTLTTVTVFLPFIFSENMIFRLVAKHVSVSIVTTLIISLVVALVLVPVLTYAFLRKKDRLVSEGFGNINLHNRLVQIYIQLLKACLRRPVAVIAGAVALLFVSIFLSLTVSVNTSREAETATYHVLVEMPSGSTLQSADLVVRELESRFMEIIEKPDIMTQVNAETASLMLRLRDGYPEKGDRSIAEIRNDIQSRFANLGNASVTLSQSLETGSSRGMGGGGGSGFGGAMGMMSLFGIGAQTERVEIKGEDFDRMLMVANDVKFYLEENLENIQSVNISIASPRPEVHLGFDPLLMGISDVSPALVAQELATFSPEISSGGTLTLGDKTYDINIKTAGDSVGDIKKNMDDLTALQIEKTSGGVVPLKEVSTIRYARGRSEIRRVNQEKVIEVEYAFTDEVNSSNTLLENSREEVRQLINQIPVFPDVAVTVIQAEDEFEEFKFLILIAVLLIYMILASVFGSFSAPFVMLFTVPLAATGSLLALTLTGASLLNLNTLIGFLILLGVVVNNGIILMDYVAQLRRGGTSHLRALMQAGISRIRPVIITAGTTVIAMIPLAMGKTEYVGSLGAPFAITVIGGLAVSTLLTLVFVPTFAYALAAALQWIGSRKRWLLITMCVLWATGLWLIFGVSDSGFALKLAFLVLLATGIPTVAWFITNSLRQAKGAGITQTDRIVIRLQNLVKIYDRPSRFAREWQSRRLAIERNRKELTLRGGLSEAVWQLPLIGFAIYFIWFYLSGNIAMFIGTILFYIVLPIFFTTGAAKPAVKALSANGFFGRIAAIAPTVYRYGFPLLAGVIFLLRWESTAGVLVVLLLWYAILWMIQTAARINSGVVNIPTGKGKLKAVRSALLNMVRRMPFAGAKKAPFKALKGVSLEFETGMIGLLGPNGAGKSTLMRNVCGILEQSYGKIFINGIDTMLKREELQGLIGYLPQEFGMYENMTAYVFLDYMALLKNIAERQQRIDRIKYVLKSVHMWEHRNERIGSYSGGMKQRIGIAMILLHLPRILVVDEPTAGLDPSERIRFRNLLVELSRERVVLFSTHIIEDISSSCNRVAVMFKGELRYWGAPVQMIQFAEGKVWQADIPEVDFDGVNRRFRIVHHVKHGNMVRIRCLSETQPFDSATAMKPLLEDAYLLMLEKRDINS